MAQISAAYEEWFANLKKLGSGRADDASVDRFKALLPAMPIVPNLIYPTSNSEGRAVVQVAVESKFNRYGGRRVGDCTQELMDRGLGLSIVGVDRSGPPFAVTVRLGEVWEIARVQAGLPPTPVTTPEEFRRRLAGRSGDELTALYQPDEQSLPRPIRLALGKMLQERYDVREPLAAFMESEQIQRPSLVVNVPADEGTPLHKRLLQDLRWYVPFGFPIMTPNAFMIEKATREGAFKSLLQ